MGTQCFMDGCLANAAKDGLCEKHFEEEHGYPPEKEETPKRRKGKGPCSIQGCIKGAVKEGLCTKHFKKEFGKLPYPKKGQDEKVDGRSIKARETTKHSAVSIEKFQNNANKRFSTKLEIDLTDYPQLHTFICEEAVREIRTPVEQIIFFLKSMAIKKA